MLPSNLCLFVRNLSFAGEVWVVYRATCSNQVRSEANKVVTIGMHSTISIALIQTCTCISDIFRCTNLMTPQNISYNNIVA